MQDFLLDVRSVWAHLSDGMCLEFRELRGGEVFKTSDFVLLGFLNFLGYRLDGWDLEYWFEMSGSALCCEVNGCVCRYYMVDESYAGFCQVESEFDVVDFSGMLFSEDIILFGDNIKRCVVPVDMFLYFDKIPSVKWGGRGTCGISVSGDHRGIVYDFSSCDDYGDIDLKRVCEYYCWKDVLYSRKYLEWFLLEHRFDQWRNTGNLVFDGFLSRVLEVNEAFLPSVLSCVGGVCGADYEECLRGVLQYA